MTSSKLLIIYRLFLNYTNSNLISSHILIISFKFFSIVNYLVACSPISIKVYACFINPMSNALLNVKSESGYTSNPTLYDICFQCLSLSPVFLNAISNGTLGRNSSIWYFMFSAIFRIWIISLSLKLLMAEFRFLMASSTNLSHSSASILSHYPYIHNSLFWIQLVVVNHRWE